MKRADATRSVVAALLVAALVPGAPAAARAAGKEPPAKVANARASASAPTEKSGSAPAGGSAARPRRWQDLVIPATGPAEAIGGYARGCLRGGVALPAAGTGYSVMRRSRHRYFGHPALVEFVEQLGRRTAETDGVVLLVGDLAQPRGGPTPYGHRSHQTGLDVDIWFTMPTPAQLAATDASKLRMRSVLRGGRVDPALWTPKQVSVLRRAAESPGVDRIFVNPRIKRALCDGFSGSPWLGRIRPWYGHDDHFHVRLACPAGSGDCAAQESLSPGDGCDTLEWWFAPAQGGKPRPTPPPFPARCSALRVE